MHHERQGEWKERKNVQRMENYSRIYKTSVKEGRKTTLKGAYLRREVTRGTDGYREGGGRVKGGAR